MSAILAQQTYTAEEYLAMERSSLEGKCEFVDRQITPMTGGNRLHNKINVNIANQKGIWFGDKESAQDDIAKIQAGDRIAIKKMLGHGAKEVEIKAIGIVEKVGKYEAMNFPILYVKWLSLIDESGQGRRVPFSGFGGTIHLAQVDRGARYFCSKSRHQSAAFH